MGQHKLQFNLVKRLISFQNFLKNESGKCFFRYDRYVYFIFKHKIKNILKSENDQMVFDLFRYMYT